MKITKVFCDMCGKLQSTDDRVSAIMENITISYEGCTTNGYKPIKAQICSECKTKIENQLKETRKKIIENEKSNS